jgi:hypothetical protein
MAPAATRNPTAMILGLLGGVLMVVGALFLDWLSGISSKGTEAGISIFWSTDPASDPSFFASAGFVVLIIGLITLVAAAIGRSGWLIYGGVLAVLAYVLVLISIYRLDAGLGVGDVGIGLWATLIGGVLALLAGVMGRRAA